MNKETENAIRLLNERDAAKRPAVPVPPAGGSLKCWSCKADFTLSERANCDGCCWKCGNEIDLVDYVTRLQAENAALQKRLNEADQRVDDLEAALKFYADKEHFHFDDPEKWDSVSGEAENLLWHEEHPAYIEDGSIARNALRVKP